MSVPADSFVLLAANSCLELPDKVAMLYTGDG